MHTHNANIPTKVAPVLSTVPPVSHLDRLPSPSNHTTFRLSNMTHMLQFRGTLPSNAREPPYVIFGIMGRAVPSEDLDIPLNMVVHFAPKLKDWMCSARSTLPQTIRYLKLHKPFVGINIPIALSAPAFMFIIKRMLYQLGVFPRGQPNVLSTRIPDITGAIQILRAWYALQLPKEGSRSLETHLFCQIMIGQPLSLADMQTLWALYPKDSLILKEMAKNHLQWTIDNGYHLDGRGSVSEWICADPQRHQLFANMALMVRPADREEVSKFL